MTKVGCELIPDLDMYIFFGKDTRDGVSYISNRYSKASNKYSKSHDRKQESKIYYIYIMYLDVNNVQGGYAMSNFLPTTIFKWTDPKEFNLNKYISNSSKWCILEVGLEYPEELWELCNDYTLAPDKI